MNSVRAHHIAEAYEHVAKANHYLVAVCTDGITDEELSAARQLLINKQNAGKQSGTIYTRLELALDLMDQERDRRMRERLAVLRGPQA